MMRNDDALSASQKMFLQAIMHQGFMDSQTVKNTYQNCRERYEESASMDHLRDFLKEINAKLRPIDMEVRKGFDEDSGVACYVFVNAVDNEFLLGSGKYTLRQMDYFKTLLRLIVMSDDGTISAIDALNSVDMLQFKLQKQDAANLIKNDWVFTDKWLKGVSPLDPHAEQSMDDDDEEENENNMLTLGTRAIVELERYVRDVFPEFVTDCNICTRICIRGIVCKDCECKVHAGCVRSYLTKQKSQIPVCPNKTCGKSRPELLNYRKSRSSLSQPSQSQRS